MMGLFFPHCSAPFLCYAQFDTRNGIAMNYRTRFFPSDDIARPVDRLKILPRLLPMLDWSVNGDAEAVDMCCGEIACHSLVN